MNLSKIVKNMYIVYTIYIIIIINCTSLEFIEMLPSLIFLWGMYVAFFIGTKINNNNNSEKNKMKKISRKTTNVNIIILIMLVNLFAVLAIKYYTGQTPITIIQNIINQKSLYYEYQNHFKEQMLGIFSIRKLPYILMLFFNKISMLYIYMRYFLIENNMTKIKWVYILFITIPHIYVGIARGTNFEFFELSMLVIFVILVKNKRSFKSIFKISVLIVMMLFIFYNAISARGMEFNFKISRDIVFESNGFIPQMISFLAIMIFDYFGFGFFYISTYINEIFLNSLGNFLQVIIPINNNIPYQMNQLIDMGARWHPDSIKLINSFGIVGLLVVCMFLGGFTSYIYNKKQHSEMHYITLFFILLQMASFTVGNFIMVSSANQLILILIFLYWIRVIIFKKKITVFN